MRDRISPDSSQFFCVGVRTGWFLANAVRNLRSEGVWAPLHNSAKTTDDVLTAPTTDRNLSRWRGDRRSSMMIDESKMTRSINVGFERKLPFVFLHQLLEALQRHDFAQGDVNGVGSRFRSEDLHGLVGQVGIQPDCGHGHSHDVTSPLYTY